MVLFGRQLNVVGGLHFLLGFENSFNVDSVSCLMWVIQVASGNVRLGGIQL